MDTYQDALIDLTEFTIFLVAVLLIALVVRIRGLEGSPLNGKFGEVVEILEDGMVQVKVADMKLNMSAGITASVTVSPISPKRLIKDADATLKLRSGGGVIYR